MKQFVKIFLPAILCLAFISCTSNIFNTSCVTVVIPDDARAANSRSQLLYTFTLSTADGTVCGTQSGSASNTIKFPDLEPGDYVMNVIGTPKDNLSDIQYEGSESFTLKAGDNKKIAIKMHTMDLFKLDDGGSVFETVIKQDKIGFDENHDADGFYYSTISLMEFQGELLKKWLISGFSDDPTAHVGDTLVFSIKGVSDKDLPQLFYDMGEDYWRTFEAPIKANEAFEIYLPVSIISGDTFSKWIAGGKFVAAMKLNVQGVQPVLSNVEISLKLYKTNKEKKTSTLVLSKGVYKGQYRYNGIVPFPGSYSLSGNYSVLISGNTKRDATVEFALVKYASGYADLTTTNENPRPTISFTKGKKTEKIVDFTINNEMLDSSVALQLISLCDNPSYKDVLVIYNFPTELVLN